MIRGMRRTALAAVATCAAAVVALAQPNDPIVPVHEEPRHRLVFDSPGTKILDVQIPPGDTTLFHTHRDPILYVTMSTSQTRSQTLGQEWTGGDAAPASRGAAAPAAPVRRGRMTSTTSYAQQPLTHRVHNQGATLFRLIGITNASAGDPGPAPSEGFDAAPELSNAWFRGYRWVLATQALEHRHANPVAIVLVAGAATVANSDGAGATRGGGAATRLDQPGAFTWIEAGVTHTVTGTSAGTEIAEFEVRRPR